MRGLALQRRGNDVTCGHLARAARADQFWNIFKRKGTPDEHAQSKEKSAAAAFQWDDPFLLESQLTEDERMIRDTARQYAQEKLQPRVTHAYLEEKTDREIFREMGELGLIGVTFPEEYGCANAGYVAYGLVAREVARRFR